jgi:hypothetical protein
MKSEFENYRFIEITPREVSKKDALIKSKDVKVTGNVSITVEEESKDGVKVLLKKDENENIKEIKFVCSCGETKTIQFDYFAE